MVQPALYGHFLLFDVITLQRDRARTTYLWAAILSQGLLQRILLHAEAEGSRTGRVAVNDNAFQTLPLRLLASMSRSRNSTMTRVCSECYGVVNEQSACRRRAHVCNGPRYAHVGVTCSQGIVRNA